MKIKLLFTSDIHGYIYPYSYSNRKLCNQSLSRLSKHIENLRDENTLLIDNGDCLQGSPMNYYHNLFEPNNIQPMAKALNYLNYDYYNLGNHDFNYGPDVLHKYMGDLNSKCLTGNVYEYGKPIGCEYHIHEFNDDYRIALIGVTSQHIQIWEHPRNIPNNTFEDAFEYVKRIVKHIKENEKVNGICVVYHGGHEVFFETDEPSELLTGENLGAKMCQEIEGIDVMLCGHQHRPYCLIYKDVAILQPLHNGMEMGYVEWDLDTNERNVSILKADQEVDEDLLKLVEEEENKTQVWLDNPLGKLREGDLLVRDDFDARLHKHPVISFINQVQFAEAKNAHVSSQALFNDSVGFNSSITMRDLVSTYVYSNTLKVIKMNGKILKEYLEKTAEYWDVEDNRVVLNKAFYETKPLHFNYEMVDGVDYTIKASHPIGSRIIEMKINGKDVCEDDEINMVLSSYRANGGGEFDMAKECEVIEDIQKDMVDVLAEYIINHPVIDVDHKDNIKVIV